MTGTEHDAEWRSEFTDSDMWDLLRAFPPDVVRTLLGAARQTSQGTGTPPLPTTLFGLVHDLAAKAGRLTLDADNESSWAPAPVGELLTLLDEDPNALETAPPEVLERSDGARMFYAGQLNGLHGRSESGKSWVAVFAAVQEIHAGRKVLYLDFESDAKDLVGRLLTAGASRASIAAHFTYVSPHSAYTPDEARRLAEMIVSGDFTLTVVDGVTDAMSLFGFDGRHERDYSEFKTALLLPLALAGSAVVTIDHVAEGSDGDKALGTQHKRASVRGASLFVESLKPLGRGRYGVARLTVAKDRRGWVRGSAERTTNQKDIAGVFVFDAVPPPGVEAGAVLPRLSFVPLPDWNGQQTSNLGALATQTEDRDKARLKTLLDALAVEDGANTTRLAELTGWNNKGEVKKVADLAQQAGLIEVQSAGSGKATTHHLIKTKEA